MGFDFGAQLKGFVCVIIPEAVKLLQVCGLVCFNKDLITFWRW